MTYMIPYSRTRRSNPARYTSVNRMIDDFFGNAWTADFAKENFKMDVQDKDNAYVIEADMPGVTKDEISLELEENTLKIAVKREDVKDEESKNYVHKERKVTSMSRSIYLRDVKSDEIDAKLTDGVLTITVPKFEKSERVKQIEIN